MKPLETLLAAVGVTCLVIGLWAGLYLGGGTREQVGALGQALVIAGAILIAGAVISSAIAGRR